jgi:DNA-binding transcriptional MerR regulator
MSENQIIQQLNRIINMLVQQTLPNKEVFNSREAALYMGLSPDYVCTLARRNLFPSSRPNGGKRYYQRSDLHNWLLSQGRESNSPTSEAEKLAILHQEGG